MLRSGVHGNEKVAPPIPVVIPVVRVPIWTPSTRNSTNRTAAPLPPAADVAIVSGTLGVTLTTAAGLLASTRGEVMAIVGVPKAAVTVAARETLVLPRSSVAMASNTKLPGVVGVYVLV